MLVLEAVVRHGSLTGAAHELSLTPAAVSKQMQQLESEADQPLLQRLSRGVQVTEAGDRLARHAEMLRAVLSAAQADLDELAGLRAGSFTVGTFPSAGATMLPLALADLRRQHPALTARIHTARNNDLARLVQSAELSMTVTWMFDGTQPDDSLVTVPLLTDPTVIVSSGRGSALPKGPLSLSELAELDWVVQERGHPMRAALDTLARAGGFEPRISYEAFNYHEAIAMAREGIGAALLPALAAAGGVTGASVRPTSVAIPGRRVVAAWRRGRNLPPAELAMLGALRRAAATYQRRIDQVQAPGEETTL